MKKALFVIPVALGLMACDPFNRAERRLDNPNGSIADAQVAVRGSFSQDIAADIVSATTGSVTATPFLLQQGAQENPGLAMVLERPELKHHDMRLAQSALALLVKHNALNDATPFVTGNIDVALETGGQCTGDIAFDVDADIRILQLFARIDARFDFDNVVCPEGSIDGFVGLRLEVDANLTTASFKLLEIVEATISDNVETKEVDFALRAIADAVAGDAVVDMSVVVDDKSLTVNIVGDLNTGEATLRVIGSDGEVTCEVTSDGFTTSVTCSNGDAFEI